MSTTNSRRHRNSAQQADYRTQPPGRVLRLPEQDDEAFTEREPLFTIGEKEYTVLTAVPASAALQFLAMSIEQGVMAANLFALRYALGDDGMQALYGYRQLTDKNLAFIVEVVTAKFTGALVGPKRRSNGSPKSPGSPTT